MPDLQAAIEQWLSTLPDTEFRLLVARTRPPREPVPMSAQATSDG